LRDAGWELTPADAQAVYANGVSREALERMLAGG
jgi:hypothetical protein